MAGTGLAIAGLSRLGLFSLSLAGIAGIVLTIGMAADSSILTLERFREEIRMGRSVRAASITGVRHGILTSIDADLVTLVSALTLFFLASASVKGFVPLVMAAAINSLCVSLSVKLRPNRAYFVQPTVASASTVFTTLPPMTPAMAMAKTMPGNAIIMSVKRMRSISIRPPQYPATIPISVPTVLIKRTTMMVMESDTRAP